MSVQGRISKAKKNLYLAKEKLDNLIPKDFTDEGRELLINLRNDISGDIMRIEALKAQIARKTDKEPDAA